MPREYKAAVVCLLRVFVNMHRFYNLHVLMDGDFHIMLLLKMSSTRLCDPIRRLIEIVVFLSPFLTISVQSCVTVSRQGDQGPNLHNFLG